MSSSGRKVLVNVDDDIEIICKEVTREYSNYIWKRVLVEKIIEKEQHDHVENFEEAGILGYIQLQNYWIAHQSYQ